MSRRMMIGMMNCLIAGAFVWTALAQEPGRGAAKQTQAKQAKAVRPPLFLREDWKTPAAGVSISAGAVANPNLELKLYGDSKMEFTGTPGDENNPAHLWTGLCTATCAAALHDKNNYVDLTGLARVRWVIKTSGFQQIRPIVKLADGTWLVGSHTDSSPTDWLQSEFSIADERWLKLDMERVVPSGGFIDHPDLSKVDEIGFTDLMPGSGHGAGGWSDVARIEVYGKAVKRAQ